MAAGKLTLRDDNNWKVSFAPSAGASDRIITLPENFNYLPLSGGTLTSNLIVNAMLYVDGDSTTHETVVTGGDAWGQLYMKEKASSAKAYITSDFNSYGNTSPVIQIGAFNNLGTDLGYTEFKDGSVSSWTFNSQATTGTAPFTVASTTLVTNLNANYLSGASLSTDTLLGGVSPSNALIPSQAAIKTYVDANGGGSGTFDGLTDKTLGTGDYSTTGDLVSGRGSGGVALTINDGYGNANVTWNHQDGIPEQAGNLGRIVVNTDSTTAMTMIFQGKSNAATAVVAATTMATMYADTGNFVAVGNVTAYSDERLKKDIKKIDNAINKVLQLSGYIYTRTDTNIQQTGVIAQEVQGVLPEVVTEDEDGILSVAYGNMAGLFIEAIKEQQEQINDMKKEITILKGL